MEDRVFVIKDLGIFEFVVSLVEFDYPVVFVAKKISGSKIELYLFDEIENNENSVAWAMTQISYDQLSLLNKGVIKLSDCFISERGMPKNGFRVISESGIERARKETVNNIISIINHRTDYYVPQFANNNHGIDLLSLVTGNKIIGFVVDQSKYANPVVNGTYVENIIRDTKSYVRSSPLPLDIKGYSFATNNSVVIGVELGAKDDKKRNTDISLVSDVDREKAVDEFIEIFKRSLEIESDEGEIINDYYGNKQSINKMSTLVSSIKNANPKGDVQVYFSNKNDNSHQEKQIIINKDVAKSIKKRNDRVINIIDNSENNIRTVEKMCGSFEMFDGSKNNGRFIFVDSITKNIYKGISNINLDFLKNSNLTMELFKNYNVIISKTVFKTQEKATKPIYKLEQIEPAENSEQIKIDLK